LSELPLRATVGEEAVQRKRSSRKVAPSIILQGFCGSWLVLKVTEKKAESDQNRTKEVPKATKIEPKGCQK
jgi:hypothetical protein